MVQVVPLQHEPEDEANDAPPGVLIGMLNVVVVLEADVGRQRATWTFPLPGAVVESNRKLNRVPQRRTLAVWSLPVPATKPGGVAVGGESR